MLPPRIILEVSCVPTGGGQWFAWSPALPGIGARGAAANDAALKLVRLAEGIAGEPVRALVTVEPEEKRCVSWQHDASGGSRDATTRGR